MTVEWAACPDDTCNAPAEVVDTFEVTGSPTPVLLASTDCANGHRFYGIDSTRLARM